MSSASASEDELRRDIAVYTWILSGIKGPGIPIVPSKHVNRNLSAAQHIVTLLTTGTSRTPDTGNQISAASVLAATVAHLPNRNITRVVFTCNAYLDDPTEIIQVKAVTPTSNAQDVLENWYTRPPGKYYEDVLAVLRAFRDGTLSGVYLAGFKGLVFRRVYPKLALRMSLGTKIWGTHPIDIIGDYPVEKLQISFPFTIELRVSGPVGRLKKRYNICHDKIAGGWRYLVTKENVGIWIRAFVEAYYEASTVLTAAMVPGTEISTRSDFVALILGLDVVHAIIRSKLLDHLLVDEGLSSVLDIARRRAELTQGIEATAGIYVADETMDNTYDDPDEAATNTYAEFNESPGHQLLRYLKTIIAWNAAIWSLTRPGHLPYDLEAYYVNLPKPAIAHSAMSACCKTIQHSIIESLKTEGMDDATVSDQFDRLVQNKKIGDERAITTVLHAETGLMSLACLLHSGSSLLQSQDTLHLDTNVTLALSEAFSTIILPIGVEKKCCWCCWKFYQFCQEMQAKKAYPEFQLLGSHMTIFPWYPPQHAPSEFLKRLRDELVEVLKTVLRISSLETSHFSQTSAESPGEYEWVDIEDEEIAIKFLTRSVK
ncbi:unnamed protein product [Somion occarium]|uniref:Uncharacterized protein n=1 Tax=Somion occarium TaxID=3059160 RepID=A0ABP1CSZ5_9APHY